MSLSPSLCLSHPFSLNSLDSIPVSLTRCLSHTLMVSLSLSLPPSHSVITRSYSSIAPLTRSRSLIHCFSLPLHLLSLSLSHTHTHTRSPPSKRSLSPSLTLPPLTRGLSPLLVSLTRCLSHSFSSSLVRSLTHCLSLTLCLSQSLSFALVISLSLTRCLHGCLSHCSLHPPPRSLPSLSHSILSH